MIKEKRQAGNILQDLKTRQGKKARESTPERKAKALKNKTAYRLNPENKAKMKAYSQRPETKAKMKAYSQRPEIKSKKKDIRNMMRLKVLQKYSKRLSNSDIPCCVCCGLNSNLDFLALDHILGKKEMDSEPELVKLGYSSKFHTNQLLNWIVDNNFPKGFQVLCTSCNFAKGMKKNNNECPMKNKPH